MEWQRRFPRPVGHGVFLTDRADWATTVELDTSEVQSDETGFGRFEEETAPASDPAVERYLDQLMEYHVAVSGGRMHAGSGGRNGRRLPDALDLGDVGREVHPLLLFDKYFRHLHRRPVLGPRRLPNQGHRGGRRSE